MNNKLISQSEYAKHRGVSVAYISKLIKTGKLPQDAWMSQGRGRLIDVEKADAALNANLSPSGKGGKPLKGKPQKGKRLTQGKVKNRETKKQKIEEAGFQELTYSEAQREDMRWKAALRKLEYDEKIKELVRVAEIRKASFDIARQVRDAILNIPDRVAPVLAAESDQKRIIEILNNELRQALKELSE